MGDVATMDVLPTTAMSSDCLFQDAWTQFTSAAGFAAQKATLGIVPEKPLIDDNVLLLPRRVSVEIVERDFICVESSCRELV